MITTIRKSFKSKAYKIVLWITLLAVGGVFSVVELARGYFGGGKNWVFTINRETIYQPEYIRNVADQEERMRMMRAQYGEYADLYFQMMGIKPNARELAADSLIRKSLLNQAAAKLPISINQNMIDQKLSDIMFIYQELSDVVPLFAWDQTLQAINMVILRNYLSKIGMSMADLDEHIAKAIKRKALMEMVGLSSYVPEFELKQRISQDFAPHQFTIMTLSGSDVLNQVKNEGASDEQLKNFFDMKNNQERRYYVPEKRSATVVTFSPADYGVQVTPEEMETYFQSQKAKYVEKPAQVQVRRILFADEQKAQKTQQELAKDPSRFAALAKELSEDKESAKQGGLIPFFEKGQKDATFERAAFVLPKEGAISPVIQTKDGYEILQLEGKKAQQFKQMSQVGPEIQKIILKKKFDDQFATDMRMLNQADDSKIQDFIKKKNGKVKTVHELANDNSLLARTLFRLTKGEKSSYKEGENGLLVTLHETKESFIPSFDTLKNQVKQDFFEHQAARTLTRKLQETKSLSAGVQTAWHTKEEAEKNGDLRKKGINAAQIFQLENVGATRTFEHEGNGYIVRLDGIKPLSEELLNEKRAQVAAQLQKEQKNLTNAGFIASLYRNAIITKNDSQLQLAS